MKARILLVEDNPLTAKGLKYLLERENYQVEVAATAASTVATLAGAKYNLILLDVSLPDEDGFTVAKHLQELSDSTPIIFLTARDDEADVVRGLELGADDYITKPFRNRELITRINNTLKRHGKVVSTITVGELEFNPASGEITMSGRDLALTALERKILACLMENANHIVTRERLLDEIWDASGSIVNDNTLSVYLKRLRQKLGTAVRIETVKSMGYRLRGAEK